MPLGGPFDALDVLRRNQGLITDVLGHGPQESHWEEVAVLRGARLRFYPCATSPSAPLLLIIPAPFKRPYIWDLLPSVSAVRRAQESGFRVYLLEWLVAGATDGQLGLADYALRLPEEVLAAVEQHAGAARAVLIGHSLGGTLAATFAALRPDSVSGLGLVDAPLAFAENGGPLAAAVMAGPPAQQVTKALGDRVPGSAINLFSAHAAPEAFVAQPRQDLAACAMRPERLAVHLRVRRWMMDEFPMPSHLFEDIAEKLYRNDQFLAGMLILRGEVARVADIYAPVAAIVNPAGVIVPPGSVIAGLRSASARDRLVLRYRSEPGPAIQHLGPLIGPRAHEVLWPRLLSWLAKQASAQT